MSTVLVASVLAVLLCLVCYSSGEEQVYYVSSEVGSDIADCGATASPCSSVHHVLNLTLSLQQIDDGDSLVTCYTSSPDVALSIILLDGNHVIDPVCLASIDNFTISSLNSSSSRIYSSLLGNFYGIIYFLNCNNITVTNLTFVDSVIGRNTIYARNTSDIHVSHCSIPVYAVGASAIVLMNPQGSVIITNVKVYGNRILNDISEGFLHNDGGSPGTAFRISIGVGSSSYGVYLTEAQSLTTLSPVNILIENCLFEKIISETDEEIYDYMQSSQRSKVMRIDLTNKAIGNTIVFRNCVFENNVDLTGSIALTSIEEAHDNTVEFHSCHFKHNTAKFGGGIATYFSGTDTFNNTINITESTFLDNQATQEGGGVFMATLARSPQTNTLGIINSSFTHNSALYGACVFLFNDPIQYLHVSSDMPGISKPIMRVSLSNTLFTNNTAMLSEGVVNALRMQLELTGTNNFICNKGSSLLLRSSIIIAGDELFISHGKAEKGAAIKVLDGSLVDLRSIVAANFTDNEALFVGGAIYADEPSSTITADEYNHTTPQVPLGNCFISMPESTHKTFYFARNKAVSSGNDFYIYCIRSCFQNYFIPEPLAKYTVTGSTIYTNFDPVSIQTDNPLAVLSTGPTYLFFYGASTKCYKQIGDLTYMLPNCSHELLMNNFDDLSQLAPCVQAVLKGLQQEFIPGHGMFHPLDSQFILPWAGIGRSWETVTSTTQTEECLKSDLGSITLSPAPGEEFDLTIQLSDELLNPLSNTVYLEVDHLPGVSPGVLIQFNGIQWAYNERVYFTPNTAISNIALVGLPGTTGFINVISYSQILGLSIVLQIPFKLSQCPLGYYDPPMISSTKEEVDQMVLNQFTQRIPSGQQPLACQCYLDYDVKFSTLAESYSSDCIGGYTASLNGILWAGLIPYEDDTQLNEIPSTSCYNNRTNLSTDSFTSLIESIRTRQEQLLGSTQHSIDNDPIDVIPYEDGLIPGGGAPVKCYHNYTIDDLVDYKINGEFSIDLCARGFCQGNSETQWYLSDVNYPCSENRKGVVCGQCKDGLSLTLTSSKCRDCSDPKGYIPFIITITLGLILVSVVVIFNVGVTPTIDSFLFFIQAIYIIVSGRLDYEAFEHLSFWNLDFTFNLCILDNLRALSRLLLQYITPMYILSLLMIVLILSKSKGFSKIFGNHSILKSLWLLILISYINIANTAFELLNCVTIGPRNIGFTEKVLIYDASVKCWTGLHLPFAIIAIIMLIFLIIPFPVYAGLAIKVPKWKPITDVYCGLYRDERRYWIVWNLLRRILVVMLSVFIPDFILRHFSLLILAVLILVVTASTWPYIYWLDNAFAMLIVLALLLFCIVTQPGIYTIIDYHQITSWSIVGVVGVITLLMCTIEISLWWLNRKGHTYSKDSILNSLTNTKDKLGEAIKPKLMNRKYQDDMEDSVTSNMLYSREHDFKDLREPLIDEDIYSFSGMNSGALTQPMKIGKVTPINSTPTQQVIISPNSIITHSVITSDDDQ